MKSVLLALVLAASCAGVAEAQIKVQVPDLRPQAELPRSARALSDQLALTRPLAPPAPSEVSGFVVARDASGALLQNENYPLVHVRFMPLSSAAEEDVVRIAVHQAGAGLRRVGRSVAWEYRFFLSADRLAADGDFFGRPGLSRDPEREHGLRFNPELWRYDGVEVSVRKRVIDPNTGRDVGSTYVGVPRPTPYADTTGFTR